MSCLVLYHYGEEREVLIGNLRPFIDLACAAGWEPMGTVDPIDDPQLGWTEEYGEWPGYYCRSSCQTVREDDARAFSRALFKALESIEGDRLTPENVETFSEICPDFKEDRFLAKVREIAEFAAEGAFQIG